MINKYKPQIPYFVEQLRQSGEDFELLTIQDLEANTEWLESNFPITFAGRIDWQKVPQSFCIKYSDYDELLSAFAKIVSEQQLEGNLILSWSNGLTLPIRANMNVVKKYAEEIFEEDWDTWICNEQDQWIIENHHDGEICFGKCRTANEKL
ncbi:MAG: hypothetical protein AAGE84_03375 [Cyanobacteria bacterium P01_G01_bin.39]